MEIDKYIDLGQEQLLIALIPEEEKTAYSKNGRLARGIELFNSYFEDYSVLLCNEYNKRKLEFDSVIDSTNIILTLLAASSQIASGVVVPFSVLVAKYGLGKLCAKYIEET